MQESSPPSVSSRRDPSLNRWLLLAGGIVLGVLLTLAVRFATYHHDMVHYHANFAVYINGQREQFKSPQYYQEVKICDLHGSSPQSRAHMHNSENSVIHVHDAAVTWGQFFENIGWVVGPDFIRTTSTMYQADESHKLNVVLNDQDLTDLTTITNQVVRDKDRLLLSYGSSDQARLEGEYKTVPPTAARYDAGKDPASCGGGEAPTLKERLRHLF